MKKFWDKLVASGLWLQPCIMLGVLKYLEKTKPQMLAEKGIWLTLFVISFLPVVLMWSESSKNPNEENAMMAKEKAIYPAEEKNCCTTTQQVLYWEKINLAKSTYVKNWKKMDMYF